jgi:hypothetical protein
MSEEFLNELTASPSRIRSQTSQSAQRVLKIWVKNIFILQPQNYLPHLLPLAEIDAKLVAISER